MTSSSPYSRDLREEDAGRTTAPSMYLSSTKPARAGNACLTPSGPLPGLSPGCQLQPDRHAILAPRFVLGMDRIAPKALHLDHVGPTPRLLTVVFGLRTGGRSLLCVEV